MQFLTVVFEKIVKVEKHFFRKSDLGLRKYILLFLYNGFGFENPKYVSQSCSVGLCSAYLAIPGIGVRP